MIMPLWLRATGWFAMVVTTLFLSLVVTALVNGTEPRNLPVVFRSFFESLW